jgi:DNA polymerase-4
MESIPDTQVRWLFLDFDSYFASCEQQAQPELRGKPVGVVPLFADTTCCLTASYQAKKYGVKTGTLVADAKILCPGIRLVLARPDLYTLYHRLIVEAVGTCLPVDAVLSIDEMIGELKGSQRELPNALALVDKMKTTLRQRVGEYLTCSVGLAPNRFLAKVASERRKPNGVTVIRKIDLPQSLYELELEDLPGIGPRMHERLTRHGIQSVKALCGLPVPEMRRLWGGVGGERFCQWLRGEDVVLPETVHRSLGHQHVLEPEFRTREGAWVIAKKLLIKAAARLRKEGYYTKRLSLFVHFLGGSGGWGKEQKLEETHDTLVLLAHLRRMWQDLPRGTPLRIGVTLLDLIAQNRHQLPLFENPARENLGPAMDQINARYGKETISVGTPSRASGTVPTRISFQRVPDLEEY